MLFPWSRPVAGLSGDNLALSVFLNNHTVDCVKKTGKHHSGAFRFFGLLSIAAETERAAADAMPGQAGQGVD